MNNELLQHHKRHFQQTEHMLFAMQPLKDLIGFTAEGPIACQLKCGIADIENITVDDYTKDTLQEFNGKRLICLRCLQKVHGKRCGMASNSGMKNCDIANGKISWKIQGMD
eukprot:11874488-Ditylum_brightwellii.AAC.1